MTWIHCSLCKISWLDWQYKLLWLLWGNFNNSIFKVDLLGKIIFLKTPQNYMIEIFILLKKGNIQNIKGFKTLTTLMNCTKTRFDEHFQIFIHEKVGLIYLKTYDYTDEIGI